jgi:hypothetical protein
LEFFAPIYNEDWLFMLPEIAEGHVASLGCISQVPYDPFIGIDRVRFQEPGDVIADGLFALLSCGRYQDRFQQHIWKEFVGLRCEWLQALAKRSSDANLRSLIDAAISVSLQLTAGDCVSFVNDWEMDRQLWVSTLRELE